MCHSNSNLQDGDRCCDSNWHCCVMGGCYTVCSKHVLTRLQCTIFHNLVFHNLDVHRFSSLFSAKLAQRETFASVLQVCYSDWVYCGILFK